MPRYFFHLVGRRPANDLIGHECNSDDEAREHGGFIAHQIRTEKPDIMHEDNFISVASETGDELFKIPIASASSAGTIPDQGITRTGRGEEQPKDKERAQTVHQTDPGDTLRPLPGIKDRRR